MRRYSTLSAVLWLLMGIGYCAWGLAAAVTHKHPMVLIIYRVVDLAVSCVLPAYLLLKRSRVGWWAICLSIAYGSVYAAITWHHSDFLDPRQLAIYTCGLTAFAALMLDRPTYQSPGGDWVGRKANAWAIAIGVGVGLYLINYTIDLLAVVAWHAAGGPIRPH